MAEENQEEFRVIQTFEEFLEEIKKDGATMIYRGQSQEFDPNNLLPRLYRLLKEKDPKDEKITHYLDEMLIEFKNMSFQYLGANEPKNVWEWLSLAQHHGLPTCFLDWTDNPIIALYFCLRTDSKSNINGIIYRHNLDGTSSKVLKPKDLETASGISEIIAQVGNVVYPRHVSRRITAQAALFSIGKMNPNGKKIIISGEKKEEIKKFLNDIGYNESSIFPHLDGLCAYIEWDLVYNKLKKEEKI